MPGPTPQNQPFPQPPTVWAFQAWYRWAVAVTQWAQRFVFDFDPPGPLPSVAASANNLATLITWEPAKKAAAYDIYRNTTGDFDTANLIHRSSASKTKVASYSYQDSEDSTQALRYYWVVPINEVGMQGPKSPLLQVTNFSAAVSGTAVGVDAIASGTNATAVGQDAVASGTSSTTVGQTADATGTNSTAVGQSALASGTNSTAVGQASVASGTNTVAAGQAASVTAAQSTAIGTSSQAVATKTTSIGEGAYCGQTQSTSIGQGAICNSSNSVAIGCTAIVNTNGTNVGGKNGVAVGAFATAGANAGNNQNTAVGRSAAADHLSAIAIGAGATATADRQAVFGSPGLDLSIDSSDSLHLEDVIWAMSRRGVLFHSVVSASDSPLTIAAAGFTDTSFQIPANTTVKAVTVRTTTVIPTAATYTVTGATTGTVFNTAAVSTAAGSTDKGNAAGAYYNAAAQNIRITPNLVPAANTGRVVVTLIYEDITPPTS